MPGPPPKKAAERRRRNKPEVETEIIDVEAYLSQEVVEPEPIEDWHPLAIDMYNSVRLSGQRLFMEPSDWALLRLTCESLSRDLLPQVVGITEEGKVVHATIPLKGTSLSAYMKVFTSLMVAEGDRRKVRLEFERRKRIDDAAGGEEKVADVVKLREDAWGA